MVTEKLCWFPSLLLLPPLLSNTGDEDWDCLQSTMLCLFCSFLLTLFPWSTLVLLPWDTVLHDLFQDGSFWWGAVLQELHRTFTWATVLPGTDCSSVGPQHVARTCQKTCSCVGSSPWAAVMARSLLLQWLSTVCSFLQIISSCMGSFKDCCVDIFFDVVLHGAAGGSLFHHGPLHRL